MNLSKLLAYGSMVSALALGPGAAYADNDCHNDTTGPDSNNECSVQIENKLDVDFDNDADFDADIDLDFNTGNNRVRDNTEAGDNTSGGVNADISGEVNIDQGTGGGMDWGWFDTGDNNASNQMTGPDSNNEAHIDIKNNVDVDVDNDADVDLDVDVDANTGRNRTTHNTKAGDTSSGDVDFKFSWTTNINQGL